MDTIQWDTIQPHGTKKGSADYIAPLQPLTLASVKTWGSSEGAGRVGLTLRRCKGTAFF